MVGISIHAGHLKSVTVVYATSYFAEFIIPFCCSSLIIDIKCIKCQRLFFMYFKSSVKPDIKGLADMLFFQVVIQETEG